MASFLCCSVFNFACDGYCLVCLWLHSLVSDVTRDKNVTFSPVVAMLIHCLVAFWLQIYPILYLWQLPYLLKLVSSASVCAVLSSLFEHCSVSRAHHHNWSVRNEKNRHSHPEIFLPLYAPGRFPTTHLHCRSALTSPLRL